MKHSKKNIAKTYLLSAIILFSTSTFADTINMFWKINNNNKKINNLTFRIKINESAPHDQFFFSNQFSFTGNGGDGYIGIQPRENLSNGKRVYRVLFSSFRADSKPRHKNCYQGADGSPNGTTCSQLIIPGELGEIYSFRVDKFNNEVTGTVTNETTGRKDIIGKWTVSDSVDSLKNNNVSWVEGYTGKPKCDYNGWPYYEVEFFNPSANDEKLNGTMSGIQKNYDSKWCPNMRAVKSIHDNTGTLIKGGFKKPSNK
ncbi:hypothetical protein Xbed_00758 [Xenorhabdus beddingii]|uniref:Uncharacterized protein n=1 Tax=Xenorhabdus beddingii TaxID=40578 RepID=A0A1Y2SSE3_9GAMM|nr:hypothetical protein [Xenorhabdus beddingii]OTA21112.1 hypothetical protein Xbed_00758 [Xenorhabdus beddingii]